MKTCQTGYSVNQFSSFQVFRRGLEVLSFKHLQENRDGMTNNSEAYDGLSVSNT